jgi:hypothetical protein
MDLRSLLRRQQRFKVLLKLTEVGNTKFELLRKMKKPDIDENVDSKTNCIIK